MAIAAFRLIMATWVQVGIAVIGTMVAIVGTIFLLRSLRYSREQTKAATKAAEAAIEANKLNQRILIADQRAWLAPKSIQIISSLTWNREQREGRISLLFQFRNTGRTPAKGAWIDAIIKINARRLDIDVYRELAAIARNRTLDFGYTIFPEDDMI